MFGGRLVSGSRKTRIPASAASALRREKVFAGSGEIVQLFTRFRIIDDGADRSLDVNRPAFVPCPIRSLTVPAALGFVLRIEAEMQQRVLMRARDQVNVASTPAIAAAGATARDELLPPEGQTAVAAVTSLDVNPDFVDEHERAAIVAQASACGFGPSRT